MIKSVVESYGTKWPFVLFQVVLCTVSLLGAQPPASVTVAGCALKGMSGLSLVPQCLRLVFTKQLGASEKVIVMSSCHDQNHLVGGKHQL